MTARPDDELSEISEPDDPHIAPFREDGETCGTPTWIWSVRVDDALYVRAYNGQDSSWHRAAVRENAGRIEAAGMTRENRWSASVPAPPPSRYCHAKPATDRCAPRRHRRGARERLRGVG
ncbi:DUF2255 family protein (plasmid) [Haladaptatus sp. SPP-AMP-3]|uniref:DUF2255 family protein n=1 Tax=Haladaptatus sp. SPP-AMP-3 TaxID=3121295 RepID=UPI003C2BC4EA